MKAFITFLLIILPFISWCQKEYREGYVVGMVGDTIDGFIKDRKPNSTERYRKIRVITEKGQRKRYSIQALKGYRIDKDIYEALWVDETTRRFRTNYLLTEGQGEKRYLRVVERSKLIHYQEEILEQGSEFAQWIDFLRRPQEKHMVRATQGLLGLKRKRLNEYFEDCTELTGRINAREINTIREILDFYSSGCP